MQRRSKKKERYLDIEVQHRLGRRWFTEIGGHSDLTGNAFNAHVCLVTTTLNLSQANTFALTEFRLNRVISISLALDTGEDL